MKIGYFDHDLVEALGFGCINVRANYEATRILLLLAAVLLLGAACSRGSSSEAEDDSIPDIAEVDEQTLPDPQQGLSECAEVGTSCDSLDCLLCAGVGVATVTCEGKRCERADCREGFDVCGSGCCPEEPAAFALGSIKEFEREAPGRVVPYEVHLIADSSGVPHVMIPSGLGINHLYMEGREWKRQNAFISAQLPNISNSDQIVAADFTELADGRLAATVHEQIVTGPEPGERHALHFLALDEDGWSTETLYEDRVTSGDVYNWRNESQIAVGAESDETLVLHFRELALPIGPGARYRDYEPSIVYQPEVDGYNDEPLNLADDSLLRDNRILAYQGSEFIVARDNTWHVFLCAQTRPIAGDDTPATHYLWHAMRAPGETSWTVETIASEDETIWLRAAALGPDDEPYVSFSMGEPSEGLSLGMHVDGQWSVEQAPDSIESRASLAIDRLGRPHVLSPQSSASSVGYAVLDAGQWHERTLEDSTINARGFASSALIDSEGRLIGAAYANDSVTILTTP